MALSRKQYVVQVAQDVAANPRATLAGHGLSGPILKLIATRPDILGKLAVFAYSSRLNKKGAKALKKSNAFKISGYRTFAEFNSKARTDVENFMGNLSENDAATFVNADNILTFIILADKATGNTEADIANLKSVVIPFDSSVKKEYKIPGGIYVTIMWGNSTILPREEVKAEVKAKINARIIARKTPAKVKAELVAKAKAKLGRIKVDQAKLKANASRTAAELQQFAEIGKAVGVESFDKPNQVISGLKNFTTETKTFLRGLSKMDLKLYKDAVAYKKAGKLRLMYKALGEVSPEFSERVTSIVREGNITTADKVLEARRKAFRLKIAEITAKNTELLAAAENAPNAKTRGNINFKIRANVEQIKNIKAKMNLHKNLGVNVIKNKAKLLASTNAAIEANKAKGMSIQDSLNNAIASLPGVSVQQKQQIKQQVIQQLASGSPIQYAVQQAIQMQEITAQVADFDDVTNFDDEMVDEDYVDVFGAEGTDNSDLASELASSKTINDILAFL